MDPLLVMALSNVEATARGAVRAARAGEISTACLEFSQASMVLGMQIGHQRARLGARYPMSPEAKAIDTVAGRLSTSITLAFMAASPSVRQPEALIAEIEGPSDDDVEVEVSYGRWGSEETE